MTNIFLFPADEKVLQFGNVRLCFILKNSEKFKIGKVHQNDKNIYFLRACCTILKVWLSIISDILYHAHHSLYVV